MRGRLKASLSPLLDAACRRADKAAMTPTEPDAPFRPTGHPEARAGRIGVLLVNLGTPEATDYWSMRRYLKEFLSDRRVIETPPLLWWPILNLGILTWRPAAKGRDYDLIWNRERNESPLKTITRAQAEGLARGLSARRAHRRSTGRCATANRRFPPGLRRCRPRAATVSCSCRSIRNIAPRRRRRSATRPSPRSKRCAGSRACASLPSLLRRPDLYRGAGELDPHFAGQARFRARRAAQAFLPWRAARLSRQGRSLLLPLRQNGPPAARGARVFGRIACARLFSRASDVLANG